MSTEPESTDPLKGIVYYRNRLTQRLGLYFAFELEPENEYTVELTSDGLEFDVVQKISTRGNANDIYLSFNVPDPSQGLWPRVRKTTISPQVGPS